MAKFIIEEHPDQLIIRQTGLSIWLSVGTELLVFFISLMFLLFPYDQLIKLNRYAWLVYLIPLFPLVRVIKASFKIPTGLTFELNKTRNQLIENDRTIDQLSNIKRIEWNIDSVSDHEESYLELLSFNQQKHRIFTTGNYLNKEHLQLGKQIARFLKIEFHNNNPLEREVLYYGQNDLSQKDLNYLENKEY